MKGRAEGILPHAILRQVPVRDYPLHGVEDSTEKVAPTKGTLGAYPPEALFSLQTDGGLGVFGEFLDGWAAADQVAIPVGVVDSPDGGPILVLA